MENSSAFVQHLLSLKLHKRLYFQKGLKALSLINLPCRFLVTP